MKLLPPHFLAVRSAYILCLAAVATSLTIAAAGRPGLQNADSCSVAPGDTYPACKDWYIALSAAGSGQEVANESSAGTRAAAAGQKATVALAARSKDKTRGKQCSVTPGDVLGPYYQSEVPSKPMDERFCQPAARGGNEVEHVYISGTVYSSTTCSRIQGTQIKMEVWQADNAGLYDSIDTLSTHNCRTQFPLPSSGKYHFYTIKPANYGGRDCLRPAHIHVRVTAKGYETLVTQLYFKGDEWLGENDCGCFSCQSGNPLLQTKLVPDRTRKLLKGKFKIYLRPLSWTK